MHRRPPSILFALVALVAPLAPAAGAQSLRERINQAIDRGVQHLLDEQEIDGSWNQHMPRYRAGQTALSTYALLECGVAPDHPAVVRALAFLDAVEPYYVYEVSVTLIAYAETIERLAGSDRELARRLTERIERYAEMLVEYQEPGGGYAYPDREIDLSNAQYAAMALRAAAALGVDVPQKLWRELADYTIEMQEDRVRGSTPSAGMRYRADHPVTGSMTAAGIATLFICSEQSKRNVSKWVTHREAALRWLDEHFVANDNPGQPGAWHYYYLYTVERVGAYLGVEELAGVPWYETGAAWLVDEQREDGSWWNLSNTAFALLFLKRATAPSTGSGPTGSSLAFGEDDPTAMVSLRAFGENPLRVWVSSFGEAELAAFGVDRPGLGRTLDVRSCEYWIDAGPGVEEPRLLGRVEGDAAATRWAVEHEFGARGTYTLRAVLRVVSPDPDDGEVELTSAPLEVVTRRGDQTELIEVARSLGRSLLRGVEVRARASSQREGDEHQPQHLVDGTISIGWQTADHDREPFASLAWNDYVRVGSIRIAHLQESAAGTALPPSRVRVTINGRDEYELDLPADRTQFTWLRFDRPEKVRGLRVDVLAVHADPEGRTRPTGLGEVSLFAPDED